MKKYLKFFIFILWFLTISLYVSELFSFYSIKKSFNKENITWFNILYANLYKYNNKYDDILKVIKKWDYDVLMFVEFSKMHYDNLKLKLEKYRYENNINITNVDWNFIFSKYPIKDLTNSIKKKRLWRYGFFEINLNWEKIHIYLIHTSSPISKTYFNMRNKQFKYLLEDVKKDSCDKKIILWDFNVTPWSFYYKKLNSGLEKYDIYNLFCKENILFTRHIFSFLWSHIDHIFYSKNLKIDFIDKVIIPWSDHIWLNFIIE